MEENEYELIVSEGRKPIWKSVVASLCFTISIGIVVYSFYFVSKTGLTTKAIKFLFSIFKLVIVIISFGLPFALTKIILIDLDKNKLVSRYYFGTYSKDILSSIPELEYISVFFESRGIFEVNLWYNKNKHYKMCNFNEKEDSFKFAEEVAKKLKLKLYDATEKGNFKWVEIN